MSMRLSFPHRTISSPSLAETSTYTRRGTLAPIADDPLEESFADIHSSKAIANNYRRFDKHVANLHSELGLFSIECRQLGRSYALISATRDLREGLKNLLFRFYDNAAVLSPAFIQPRHAKNGGSVLGVEAFPLWFEGIAEACNNFLERLNEFREYGDESAHIKSFMDSFSKDLRYRAECLKEYRGKLETEDIRYYIHDLASEMEGDLINLHSAFRAFNEHGMSAVKYEQRRDTETLQNMSTVATFFSAVTATTLQISLSFKEFPLIPVVNTFWFCSLVLSIGAALNSLLALTWKRTTRGSRGRHLPQLINFWVHFSAPGFLTISITCFVTGLATFVYAINQSTHTKVVTLFATAVTSFGFIIMTSWFGYELWLRQPPAEMKHLGSDGPSPNNLAPSATIGHPHSRSSSLSTRSDGPTRSEISSSNNIPQALLNRLAGTDFLARISAFIQQELPGKAPSPDLELQPVSSPPVQQPEPSPTPSRRREKSIKLVTNFQSDAHQVIYGAKHTPISPTAIPMNRSLTLDSLPDLEPSSLQPFPEKPTSTHQLPHGDLRDIEYSPDGEYLVTTSYNKQTNTSETVIHAANMNYQPTGRYIHDQAATKQVSWSLDGSIILVQLDRSISFLDKDGRQAYLIRRPQRVESASWLLPEHTRNTTVLHFLTAEKSTVFRINLDGQVQAKYRFGNLLLRDVIVTPHPGLLLVTGRVAFSRRENLPRNSRGEKQLILYDAPGGGYISRHPILDDVRYIRLSRHPSAKRGFDMLLSHKDQHKNPPRLWTLPLNISTSPQLQPGKIILQPPSELAGHSHFIGEHSQMIACVGQDGDIHIWDRDSGTHIHSIQARAITQGVRCFAWRPSSTHSATFVSASLNELKVWSNDDRAEGRDLPPSQTQNISQSLATHTQ